MAKKIKARQKNTAPQQQVSAQVSGDKPPAAPGRSWSPPLPLAIVLGLAIAFGLLLIFRWHFIDMPLERDESAYAYLGKRTLEGQIPYRDFYEMKPPLLFYSYAALVALFGYTAHGLHWAALGLSFWNAAWIFGIGSRLLGLFYGFLACTSYVLLTANPNTTAVLLESELVLMAFVLPGLYCMMQWDYLQPSRQGGVSRSSWYWLFACGFLLACGLLVKQSALFFFGVPALLILVHFWQQRPRIFSRLLLQGAWLAAGAVVPVLIIVLIISALGVWKEFWFWNVEYLKVYSSALQKDIWTTAFSFSFDLLSKNFRLYWWLAGAGLLALLSPIMQVRHRVLLVGVLLFSFAAVTPGWRFYGHYWLQFLPALALLTGALFYHLEKAGARLMPKMNLRPLVVIFAVLLLGLPIAQNSILLFKSDLDRLVRSMYPGNPFAEDKVLAEWIAKRQQPGDKVAVLGSEPQYYIYLNQEAPSRHFYTAFIMRPIPQSAEWQQEALDSILQPAPRFIVFNFVEYSWMPKKNSVMTFYEQSYKYAREHYRPVAWADMLSLTETKFVLDETVAPAYKPQGSRYVTIYERKTD